METGLLGEREASTTDRPWSPPYVEVDALVALLRRVFGIDYWAGTNHYEFGVLLHVALLPRFHVASRNGPSPRFFGRFDA